MSCAKAGIPAVGLRAALAAGPATPSGNSVARASRLAQHHGASLARLAPRRGFAVANTPSATHKISRFYKEVDVVPAEEDLWTVTLDGRRLKTPMAKPVLIPDETLAQLAAAEWDSQGEEIKQSGMHVSSLINTAIDHPSGESRGQRVDYLLEFLDTDTVCCHSDSPDALVVMQQTTWDPIIEWFSDRFQAPLNVHTSAVMGSNHPEETTDAVRSYLMDMPHWPLVGLEHAVDTSKSLIIPIAQLEGHLTAEEAAEAARLEVAFQTSRFGYVDWAHGIEEHDTHVRMAAAALFSRLTRKWTASDPEVYAAP